ncbi:hypothetical protein D3C80_1999770 [compost metagenome]
MPQRRKPLLLKIRQGLAAMHIVDMPLRFQPVGDAETAADQPLRLRPHIRTDKDHLLSAPGTAQ